MKRRVLFALGGAVASATGCSAKDEAEPYRELQQKTIESQGTYEALPLAASEVHRLVVTVNGQDAEVVRDDFGVWQPGPGADTNSAGLIAEGESLFFPLIGYRRLTVDPEDPQFGFTTSDVSFVVETRTATRHQVRLGGQNLNGGGYYASVAGDPYVYLVIPQVFDYALAIEQGERVVRPPDPRFQQALDRLEQVGDPEVVTNPWLAQILDEEGDA